jgi:hypothetical protein
MINFLAIENLKSRKGKWQNIINWEIDFQEKLLHELLMLEARLTPDI